MITFVSFFLTGLAAVLAVPTAVLFLEILVATLFPARPEAETREIAKFPSDVEEEIEPAGSELLEVARNECALGAGRQPVASSFGWFRHRGIL